ncbi:hypothetical protein [Streptomyces botrytidirepellens]|nr:hypothetical protein [Streptomyces botrytidirepellens]
MIKIDQHGHYADLDGRISTACFAQGPRLHPSQRRPVPEPASGMDTRLAYIAVTCVGRLSRPLRPALDRYVS